MLLLWRWLAVCLLCINQCWVLSLDCCTWATELLHILLKLYHLRFYLYGSSNINVLCTLKNDMEITLPNFDIFWERIYELIVILKCIQPRSSDWLLYQDYDVMVVAHCTQLLLIVLEQASCIIDHVKEFVVTKQCSFCISNNKMLPLQNILEAAMVK